MVNSLWALAVFSACVVPAYAEQGLPAPGACAVDEVPLFACLVGKKQLSLCASPDLSADKGTLQYRFGRPGMTPELQIPPAPAHPTTFASIWAQHVFRKRAHYALFTVQVVNQGVEYELTWHEGAGNADVGELVVSGHAQRPVEIRCDKGGVYGDWTLADQLANGATDRLNPKQ